MKKLINEIKTYPKLYIILLLIFIANISLRLFAVFYGYIGNEDGILLNNSRLAGSGLIPFIDYNGWNSLLNDYLNQIPLIFFQPSILVQRLYGMMIALIVFIITLKISRNIGNLKTMLLTGMLLGLGSSIYIYFSNYPFSDQLSTFFVILSLFLLSKSLKKINIFLDMLALIILSIAVLERSQNIPVIFLSWIYVMIYHNYSSSQKLRITLTLISFIILLYIPFLLKSWQNTLYAIFWPFYANKILLYVSGNNSITLSQITSFIVFVARDYGIYFTLIIAGLIANFKQIYKNKVYFRYLVLIFLICLTYIFTGIIHHPADASYICPAVPLLSLLAASFSYRSLEYKSIQFFLFFLIFVSVVSNFILFPHYKFVKTSLDTISLTPHELLQSKVKYVEAQTNPDDLILTMYLPVVAESNRQAYLNMNEGPGSISILSDQQANKWHLTSLSMLKDLINRKKFKLIILNNRSKYFFGRNESERNEAIALINQNYQLKKEFTDFGLITGPADESLFIYSRLPD